MFAEEQLAELIREFEVDEVVLAYSDLSHEDVMHKASIGRAGANFSLLGPNATMLRSAKPVIAVGAVRTGAGKSQTSRRIGQILLDHGLRVALVLHPMPYGDLEAMRVQRFASQADIDASNPTIEEREEYERPVELGMVVQRGDYGAILDQAEQDADVIVWDGGNNDFPFFRPDLFVVVTDPPGLGTSPVPPGRDEPADGGRRRRQQGRLGDAGAGRAGARRRHGGQPGGDDRAGGVARHAVKGPTLVGRSVWSSTTARRSPTADALRGRCSGWRATPAPTS